MSIWKCDSQKQLATCQVAHPFGEGNKGGQQIHEGKWAFGKFPQPISLAKGEKYAIAVETPATASEMSDGFLWIEYC